MPVVASTAGNGRPGGVITTVVSVGAILAAGLGVGVLALLTTGLGQNDQCQAPVGAAVTGPGAGIALGPPGTGQLVGATEYGGPGDPSSGVIGSSGANLIEFPDSYAELGGISFQTATAMGGLPYLTPLRITWGNRSAIAYKRDIGHGGGPIDGLPRVLDLWWELAGRLGIPYENGLWSGPVQIERPPPAGAGNLLDQSAVNTVDASALITPPATAQDPAVCAPVAAPTGVPITSADHAQLLTNGLAAAPADAPVAVQGIIAAGNQIVGKPYLYGGGHGLPLSESAPAYDCSSSVEHLLYGGGLLPVDYDAPSGTLESFGAPGPGRWVTIYASADHVFMYVAGLRWDTHNAAGPGDGSTGIGWHPLIRSSAGFVVRHPVGL